MNDNQDNQHLDGDAARRAMMLGLLGVGGLLAAQRAQAAYTGKTLVVLFQRFGADGLMELVPYNDPKWTEYRVAEARPDSVLPIGTRNYWGLHPRFGDDVDGTGSFKQVFWDTNQLALIPGTFVPDGDSRSHFSAQADMEVAAFGANVGTDIGFCSRILDAQPLTPEPTLRGTSLSSYRPDMARGDYSFVSIANLDGFYLQSRHAGISEKILAMFPADEPGPNAIALKTAQALVDVPQVAQASPAVWAPATYTEYLLHNAARLIRAKVGTQIITIDVGGWDLHTGVKQGMDDLLRDLSRSLVRFRKALVHNGEDLWNSVNVVVMTEFGRTLHSNTPNNGIAGTDHGWGSLMMVLGGAVKGGIYDAAWPHVAAIPGGPTGLAAFENNAVGPLNDYRHALAEVARRTLGLPLSSTSTQPKSLQTVFPGFGWQFHNFLPVLA
ncbi:MAG TPA: DUF1501 domain-containing protein [Solimonas sp.]|nr:DUF1501 domain-containing protein [Solimonas sp.]